MFEPISSFLLRLDNELQSPLIKWSGLAILICIIYLLFIDPYVVWRNASLSQITMQQQQLNKQEQMVNSLDSIESDTLKLQELTKNHPQQLLKETSDTAAQSTFMGLLYKPVHDNKLTIKGRRFSSNEAIPYLGVPISINLTLVGELANMYHFLDRIQRGSLLLIIDNVRIRPLSKHSELQLTLTAYRQLPLVELQKISRQAGN